MNKNISLKTRISNEILNSVAIIVIAVAVILGDSILAMSVPTDQIVSKIESQGFVEIEIKSRSNFFVNLQGCSADDSIKVTFAAKNINGDRSELIACSGSNFPWSKGLSIRSK